MSSAWNELSHIWYWWALTWWSSGKCTSVKPLNQILNIQRGEAFPFDDLNLNECFDPLQESSPFFFFFFFFSQIQHRAAKHSGCHGVTCPRRVLVDPEPLGWATSSRIYTFFENTVNALERSDKDSNFASQCTLCQPLMANGVNNYKATLR